MTNSKVWIYQANRKLSIGEEQAIQEEVEAFLANWKAHGKALVADFEIRHHLFLILKVNEQFQSATGCAIDKSVELFKQIEQQYDFELFDRHQFAYEYNGQVQNDHLTNLTDLYQQGFIADDTIVFNNLVSDLFELDHQFRIPFKESWHRRLVSPAVLQN